MNSIHHLNGQHSEQHIRDRAYALWVQAGSPSGRDLEFWLEAEREMIRRENLKTLIASAISDPVLPLPAPKSKKKAVSRHVNAGNLEPQPLRAAARAVKSAKPKIPSANAKPRNK